MGMGDYEQLADRVATYLENGDFDSAYNLIENEKKNGNCEAITILGEMYLNGIGVPKDEEKALTLLEDAFNKGSGNAADVIGLVYQNGENGITQDMNKALQWFEKALSKGIPISAYRISDYYINIENFVKAFEYAQRGAKLGDVSCMESLGTLYDDGCGVPIDPGAAIHWYQETLNREPDNDFCMCRIAFCMTDFTGKYGVSPSVDMLSDAYELTCRAVRLGNLEAHVLLAWFFEQGQVVQQDYDVAHKYMQIAADNGCGLAIDNLPRFKRNIAGHYYV